jgi:hypothetical protein
MTDRTASTITVAADRATVMGVIADFESGPGGRPLRVRFGLDTGLIRDSYVLSYEWDGDAEVRWQLAEAGSMVTEMTGGYVLSDDGGQTRVSYELAVGTKVPLPGLLRRRAEKTIIDTALRGLKSRVQSGPAAGRR